MRKLVLVVLVALGGVAAAQDYDPYASSRPPPANAVSGGYRVWEQRGLYNTVKLEKGRRLACGGSEPVAVRTKRTALDWTGAVITLGLWTPAHVYVSC